MDHIRYLLLEQIWTLIEEDNGRDALPLLEVVTEEYLANWEYLDDSDREASAFLSELGIAWTDGSTSERGFIPEGKKGMGKAIRKLAR